MPSTPKFALPYPAGTAAPDVPYHLQQLAQAIETYINTYFQAGIVTVNPPGTAGPLASAAVVFPVPLPAGTVPVITCQSGTTTRLATPSSITNLGFTMNVRNNDNVNVTSATTCYWNLQLQTTA